MPPELDQEDYASSEDSDFAPEDAQERASSPSDDDGDDDEQPASSKRKRSVKDGEADDAGFENSGDEAVIGKGRKRRKKTKGNQTAANRIDQDDEEVLIKTRSMRAQEKVERKFAASKGPVTIDVDALWAQMIGSASAPPQDGRTVIGNDSAKGESEERSERQLAENDPVAEEEASIMIRIKRTYNFAGKVHTEEKLVARDSAEAKLYLASLGDDADLNTEEDLQTTKRMPRKAFRSAFEPISDQLLQRADLNLGMSVRLRARELAKEANAKKLNTVEKSRMDWAGYVDKEGIKDELEMAGKSKTSFAARQDFLVRSEAIREEEARRARLAGRV